MNKNWTITVNKQNRHWITECLMKGRIVTVQYLQGLNIFVTTELTIATLFAWMLIMRNQMLWQGFLRSGGGGWYGRAIARWRPRVSKLGLKGLSDYHSNEMAVVAAARQKGSGPNKRTTLTKHLLKSERWTTALHNRIKSKRQPTREKHHS